MAAMSIHLFRGCSAPRLRRLPQAGVLAVALVLAVTSCAVHTGGSELAFLRGGQLWAVQGDGSNARLLAGNSIVGFAWAPDHHSLVFRTANGATGNGPAPDAVGSIQAISINGGTTLQLSPDDAGVALSDAWWDADGNRVLYREANLGTPDAPLYIVSQTDQPLGLAHKVVADAAAIPALAPDGQRVALLDAAGEVLLGTPGATATTVEATGALTTLPQTGRPARVLWQPRRDALLYSVAASGGVTLVLRTIGGAAHTVATLSALLDTGFSPDGTWVLARTPTDFELWSAAGAAAPAFTWPESDPVALPYWSPDGKLLLVRDAAGLQLVNVAARRVQSLLTLPQGGTAAGAGAAPRFWRPATDDPWAPDGASVVFVGHAGATWSGKPLPATSGAGPGLYVASVSAAAVGAPALVDGGADAQPGWSYADPATVYLVGSTS
jgi:hypothetical protein